MIRKIDSPMEHYEVHLRATAEWLLASIEHGNGGSAAHYAPILGWSKPYPETTGYIIPTLLKLSEYLCRDDFEKVALRLGEWLLEIQRRDGAWNGGLHSGQDKDVGSVFNTGQILKGLCALYRLTADEKFLEAGAKGANWLAAGVSEDGLWPSGDYQSNLTPSYYTHVCWPMLETWSETGDNNVRDSAVRFLDTVVSRRLKNGVISGWGFKEGSPAFTHTIAYTIRGLQESARLLDDYSRYGEPIELALEVLVKKSELRGGRLPGRFDESWVPAGGYQCLTGNVQLAFCFLLLEERVPDLRLVSAAARLIDAVCDAQNLSSSRTGIKGGVAGSSPLWGRYMTMRYPNWAAKYHCDALIKIMARLEGVKP
ncbi:MAG: hypothetical protein NPIRA05_00110 [Nitrospirales bacterium]|nr:MAG: hypothetical protein NPIRA05_00110 [Nitrospirales bacterium]